MKHVKLWVLFLCAILLSTVLSGCWNYTDIETQFVVMGVTIDKDPETQEFIMLTEVSKAKGGADAELITRIESGEGVTLFDASRNSIMKIGAKLYWGHTMVYIISESVAREGIADVMSMLSRQTQIRSDLLIMICEDDSIDKVFEFDDPIHETTSEHLYDLMQTYEAAGKYRRTPLYVILQELASDEVSLVLPIIKIEEPESEDTGQDNQETKDSSAEGEKDSGAEDKKADTLLLVEGSAIFKADKMVGKLSEIETRSALILKNEVAKNYVLSIEADEKNPACSIEIINSDLKIKPTVAEDEKLAFKIDLDLEGDLVELQSLVDYITDEKKGELESAFETMMEKELADVIKKGQLYESDFFGFAGITHRKEPEFWKSPPYGWIDMYKDAAFDITVTVDITGSSLSQNPVKVGS